jgi:hypothetical protein
VKDTGNLKYDESGRLEPGNEGFGGEKSMYNQVARKTTHVPGTTRNENSTLKRTGER